MRVRVSGRPTAVGVSLMLAAGLAVVGCGGSSGPAPLACSAQASPAGGAGAAGGSAPPAGAADGAAHPAVAPGWTLPGGNLANTRDVASAINSSNVSQLGVAWTVPLRISTAHTDGAYATTPVVVNGVVYVQDLESNVMAISLATGQVLWTHTYNSPNGGPDGVNVANGVVYAATNHAAFALSAATGRQLWIRTLIGNDHEGIDMTPGYNHGTVYVATVPVNPTVGEYLGGGKGILWALNAATGAPEWSWDEVQDLWGKPGINSGGGQWYPPSFDAQGNIYIGVANPAPLYGTPAYPWGSSRPGPNLYTDSVVKLSPQGKLLWYYQLTPHDLYDWDMQNPPVLTTAHGQPVVIDGGKAGILIELNAQTGQLLWKLPVGVHNGHDHDGLLTEYGKPTSHVDLPKQFCLEPGVFGGIETQLASNGSTTFAAVNDIPLPVCGTGTGCSISESAVLADVIKGTGEMVAVNQDTRAGPSGTPSCPPPPMGPPRSPTTSCSPPRSTVTCTRSTRPRARSCSQRRCPREPTRPSPSTVTTSSPEQGAPLSARQQSMIIAYKLGGTGKLPDTAGS